MLLALGFGFSAWAVYLAGLTSIHGSLATDTVLTEFHRYGFAWFLACSFLVVWLAILICWLKNAMAASSRILTAVIAILISWFGTQTHDVLFMTLQVSFPV